MKKTLLSTIMCTVTLLIGSGIVNAQVEENTEVTSDSDFIIVKNKAENISILNFDEFTQTFYNPSLFLDYAEKQSISDNMTDNQKIEKLQTIINTLEDMKNKESEKIFQKYESQRQELLNKFYDLREQKEKTKEQEEEIKVIEKKIEYINDWEEQDLDILNKFSYKYIEQFKNQLEPYLEKK